MEGSGGGLEWFQRIRILPLLAPGGSFHWKAQGVGWSGSRGSGFYLCWLQEEVSNGGLQGWTGVVPEDQDFTSVGSRRSPAV